MIYVLDAVESSVSWHMVVFGLVKWIRCRFIGFLVLAITLSLSLSLSLQQI